MFSLKAFEIRGLFLLFIVIMCNGDIGNSTKNRNHIDNDMLHSLKRLPRFLTFKTIDEDVKVDLEFTVPFIKIPVKRSQDVGSSFAKGMANINMASLVLTGIVVLVAASLSAAFSTFGTSGWKRENSNTPSSRFNDPLQKFAFGYTNSDGTKAETTAWTLFEEIENSLRDYNIDVTSCFQKTACLVVQKSSENVLIGGGSAFDKIIDGMTSSRWLLSTISGTAIKDAIEAGRNDLGCVSKYKTCKLSEEDLKLFVESF